MPDLRIYGVARTRAFRALWIANELGLDYEHIPIEIGPAGARKAEYLAINPNGRLPAIDDGGFVLWESLAITLYLAKKHGRLYPATLEGEAKAWQWSLLVGAGGRPRRQHLVVACRAASARGP
jgi:glutathione S-transferase